MMQTGKLPKDIPGQVELDYDSEDVIPLAIIQDHVRHDDDDGEDDIPLALLAKWLEGEPSYSDDGEQEQAFTIV